MAIYSGFPTTVHTTSYLMAFGIGYGTWSSLFCRVFSLHVFGKIPKSHQKIRSSPWKKCHLGSRQTHWSIVYIVYIIIPKSWCFDNKTGQFSESIDTKNSDPFLCEMASSVGRSMVDVGVDCWWMAWRIILLFINRNGEKLPLSQRIWCVWRAEISAACMHPYLWVKPNGCIRLVHHLKLPKQIVFWQTTLEDRLKNIYLLNLGIELWYTWVSFFGLTCLYNGPCCLLARPGFICWLYPPRTPHLLTHFQVSRDQTTDANAPGRQPSRTCDDCGMGVSPLVYKS